MNLGYAMDRVSLISVWLESLDVGWNRYADIKIYIKILAVLSGINRLRQKTAV